MKYLPLLLFLFACSPPSEDWRVEKAVYYETHPDFGTGPVYIEVNLKVIYTETLTDSTLRMRYTVDNPLTGATNELNKVYTFRDSLLVDARTVK